jgi:hypothetical protein
MDENDNFDTHNANDRCNEDIYSVLWIVRVSELFPLYEHFGNNGLRYYQFSNFYNICERTDK